MVLILVLDKFILLAPMSFVTRYLFYLNVNKFSSKKYKKE
jgi:hypothetical protein